MEETQELFVQALQLFCKSEVVLKKRLLLNTEQLQRASFQAKDYGWMKSKVCSTMRGSKPHPLLLTPTRSGVLIG